MLRTAHLLWFLVLTGSSISAQNLVPNPSFEICDNCNAQGSVELSVGGAGTNTPADWRAATYGTSDIRSADPRTGRRHGGLFAGTKYEYLANQLTEPLEALSLYNIEFYVKSAFEGYLVDEIGFNIQEENPEYFVFTALDSIEPFYKTPDQEFIDATEYRKYEFEYLACGGEKYILIGRFQTFGEGDTLYTGTKPRPSQIAAYYMFDDVAVIKKSDFEPFPQDSILLCGDTLLLEGFSIDTANFEIELNGSPTTLPLLINSSGSYFLEIVCKSSGESVRDTVHVYEDTLSFTLPVDTAICSGEVLMISGPEMDDVSYRWNNGDTTRFIEIDEPQIIILTLNNGCVHVSDTMNVLAKTEFFDEEKVLPNAFTPNGDNLNDVLRIDKSALEGIEILETHFTVYNRWGQQVFHSESPDFEWRAQEEISEVYLCCLHLTFRTCQMETKMININTDVTLIK